VKTKCDFCGGRFGFTRRKWLGYQFCKKECEFSWKAKREATVAAFRRWLSSPAHRPTSV
jgi:hypothetical protein